MKQQRIQKSSWNSPIQERSARFAPRPFAIQAQPESTTQHGAESQSSDSKRLESASQLGFTLSNIAIHAPAVPPIQAKLTIGAPGDKYEQEADRVAAQVVRQINTPVSTSAQRQSVQRQEESEEKLQAKPSISHLQRSSFFSAVHQGVMTEQKFLQAQSTLLQRREAIGGGAASANLESAINTAKGSGQPLDAGLQQSMGRAMGADFSGVRVHADAQSDQLNRSIQAKAFTTGKDVFFRQGAYQPESRSGQELIAHELTHVVQQNGGAVQRHPSHAEEEELQTKLDIQRHPSHAEEEELQAKFTNDSPSPLLRVQHQPSQILMRDTLIQRGPIDWIKKRWKGQKGREQELTQKYGVQIGGGPSALPHGVLDKLDKVLAKIPKEHLTGTYLQNIGGGDGIGDASAYTQDSDKKGHIGIVVPSNVPDWLYPLLSKAVRWQRKQMDQGAIASLAPGVTQGKDEALGLNNAQREVFAGVSDVLSRGGLLEWTILHEMGHAVDHKIKFTQTQAKKPEFGGWKQYEISKEKEMEEIALQFLRKANIDLSKLTPKNKKLLIEDMRFKLGTGMDMRPAIVNGCNIDELGNDQKIKQAVKAADIARSQPWMFSDGGQNLIGMPDNRIYHLDHYGTWVSYLIAARGNALSNYQFSSPGEWFAEAYAAFYDLNPDSPARNRLNAQTRTWFTQNLGLPPQRQTNPATKPGLADHYGILQDLEEIAKEAAQLELVEQYQDYMREREDEI